MPGAGIGIIKGPEDCAVFREALKTDRSKCGSNRGSVYTVPLGAEPWQRSKRLEGIQRGPGFGSLDG